MVKSYHFASAHAPKSPCETCGKMVGPGRVMETHIKANHEKITYVQCDFVNCGRILKGKSALRGHFIACHITTEPVLCPICGSDFKNEQGLKTHIKLHKSTETIQCPITDCKFDTTTYDYMITHFKRHKKITEEERMNFIQEYRQKKRRANRK